jgi:hypothetical protein
MTIITEAAYTPGDSPPGVPLIGYETRIASIASTTAAMGFPASNLLNPATHLTWKASFDSPAVIETLTITISSGTVNYIGIAKHNFFESAAHIALGTGASPPDIISSFTVSNALPIILRFSPRAGPLLLTITGGTQAAQAAVIYAGTLLVLERGVKADAQHMDIVHARQSNVLGGLSESGNFLGRVLTGKWRESEAEFAWFTPSWYRANFEPFAENAMTEPFFWAWNPSEYPADTAYAWLIEEVRPLTDPATRRMAATLSMRAIA